MPIAIKKQDGDTKLYGSWIEPIITIYSDSKAAVLNYIVINNIKEAIEISDAVMVAGLIVNSIAASNGSHFKNNNIETLYINEVDLSATEALYSPRKVLKWLESNKVVTVNKRERIRYKFTNFSYRNGKLVIFYKPVAW